VTKQSKVYSGLVADVAALVGLSVMVTVFPKRGKSVSSILADPKSWKKSSETLPSFSPPMRVREVLPKAVVSCSSTEMSRVTELIEELKSVPPI